jgi:hypothetical protein
MSGVGKGISFESWRIYHSIDLFNIDLISFGRVCMMGDDGMSVGVQKEIFQQLPGAAFFLTFSF